MTETRRLFFALSIDAPWPTPLPGGRLLAAEARHITLAFLGNISWPDLEPLLPFLPLPPYRLGLVGKANECLLLPPRHPRVVAYHVEWLGSEDPLAYQQQLVSFLREHGYQLDERPFLAHVTLARAPFDERAWRKAFKPLPIATHALHLYESVGNLVYEPIWSHQLSPPFVEISHTADVAFRVFGESMQQLGVNAQVALAFKCPELLRYVESLPPEVTLDDIIIALNAMITRADSATGCSLKAVSFHGEVEADDNALLSWEMVVDV